MSSITYTYTGKLPYHATHKIDGKWVDVCLGTNDTVDLPVNICLTDARLNNLVKRGLLVNPAAPKTSKNKKVKEEKSKPAQQIIDNDQNSQ